jgi:putative transposase
MVTGATYLKQHHLTTYGRLNAFTELLLQRASEAGTSVHAWAVFSNHYHLVVVPACPGDLRQLFSHLHSDSARALNDADGQQ